MGTTNVSSIRKCLTGSAAQLLIDRLPTLQIAPVSVEAEEDGFCGPCCPIRKNYELLATALVRSRLLAFFQLSDFNELRTWIRRVLMLLTNAILGHPLAKDRLLLPRDIRETIAKGLACEASLYSNLFGANLSGTKRESLEIFDYLGRFGIDRETTNRIDNILIFGAKDENLRPYYDTLIGADEFYGGTDRYRAAQHAYVETPEATLGDRHVFWICLWSNAEVYSSKFPTI